MRCFYQPLGYFLNFVLDILLDQKNIHFRFRILEFYRAEAGFEDAVKRLQKDILKGRILVQIQSRKL